MMTPGGVLIRFLCRLNEQRKERIRGYRREERARKAERDRAQGWKDLYDHMSRRAARAKTDLTSQPGALTARAAATEAQRDDIHAPAVEP
ncbi:uncharacterized membrane-anchored protein YhcB (DUF1043 family) [Bradyrhizobium sp. BR13661]|jgi:hypothetical protein|nr:uncharacterized membrane-anchored protein YhcB (DUF1043 family) [Bradyrhizobium sp. BR13661]